MAVVNGGQTTSGRSCIFCGERPGSHEHIFPNWLNGVFPVDGSIEELPEWARHRASDAGVEVNTWTASEIASVTSKLVCHDCNTGWMARLEARAKPLLVPMMTGQRRTYDQAEQFIVATWATKTVMAIEPSLTHEENFSSDQCRIVMSQDRPPASVEVSVSGVEGPIPPMGFSCARVQMQVNGSPFSKYHFYTIYFGTLVLQVLRPDPPPADYGTLERMAVPREIAVSPDRAAVIFPPATSVSWPPREIYDWDGLVKHTRRGIDMPENWAPSATSSRGE